jgi:hypothetical protein
MNITMLTLVLAMIQVESSGNDQAVGDDGFSYGCLQLQADYVYDAAAFANQDWKHDDAYDRRKSLKIMSAYMARYATEKRLGRPVTAEDIARIHNGGPNGYRWESTKKYWVKVKAELVNMGALPGN